MYVCIYIYIYIYIYAESLLTAANAWSLTPESKATVRGRESGPSKDSHSGISRFLIHGLVSCLMML